MKFVTPLLKKIVYPAMSMSGLLPRIARCGLAVVTYHGVIPAGYNSTDAALDGNLVSADALRRQLRLLKARYQVISPDDARAWSEGRGKLPSRAVLVTCDDGLLNCLTDMLRVLKEEKVSCLFFVTGYSTAETRSVLWYEELYLLFREARAGRFEISSDFSVTAELGSVEARRAVWWDCVRKLSQFNLSVRNAFIRAARAELKVDQPLACDAKSTEACRRFGLMTASELRELTAPGMAVGAHTMSHPMLSRAPSALAYEEIAGSRAAVSSTIAQPVWAFAYPFGDRQSVTPEVLTMTEKAGFSAAFLNYGGGLGVDLPRYSLPRVHVTAEMSLAELEVQVSGLYSRLRRLAPSADAELAHHELSSHE